MSLSEVHITDSAYLVCLTHALTTEKEEVMGLLVGDIETLGTPQQQRTVARIQAVSILTRSDKRKDRVEISAEQLSSVSGEAEKLSEKLKRPLRVVGWYHSHPHITVHPSHVDVQTQLMYQLLDKGFIGLIFSCFNKDPSDTSGRIQVTAFQSLDVSKFQSESIIDLNADIEMHPADSKSGYEAIDVPLRVISSPPNSPNCFEKIHVLNEILYGEERTAYSNSLKPPPGLQTVHPFVQIHSAAVYQKSLCRLLELETTPTLLLMQQKQNQNLERLQQLKEEKRLLELQSKNKKTKN